MLKLEGVQLLFSQERPTTVYSFRSFSFLVGDNFKVSHDLPKKNILEGIRKKISRADK